MGIQMSFLINLLKNFGPYAILISLLAYYYYNSKSLEKTNEDINKNLQRALNINESLNGNIKQMQDDFNNQLKAVSEAHKDEKDLNKKIESVKNENNKNSQDTIIKRFNSMLDRLYEQ